MKFFIKTYIFFLLPEFAFESERELQFKHEKQHV